MNKQQIKLFSSKKTDHWQTPKEIYEWLDLNYGFKFYDPCPRNPKKDGLKTDWEKICFVNPPYSQVEKWFSKAWEEIKKGNSHLIIFLVFANTDTKWFHKFCYSDNKQVDVQIKFWQGRLKFISDEGVKNSAMRPSMLVILTKIENESKK